MNYWKQCVHREKVFLWANSHLLPIFYPFPTYDKFAVDENIINISKHFKKKQKLLIMTNLSFCHNVFKRHGLQRSRNVTKVHLYKGKYWRMYFFLQSVIYGMLFAFGYQILKKYNLIRDTDEKNLFSTGISCLVTLLGLIGIGVRFHLLIIFFRNFFCNRTYF